MLLINYYFFTFGTIIQEYIITSNRYTNFVFILYAILKTKIIIINLVLSPALTCDETVPYENLRQSKSLVEIYADATKENDSCSVKLDCIPEILKQFRDPIDVLGELVVTRFLKIFA